MKKKTRICMALVVLLSVALGAAGIYLSREYRTAKEREAADRQLQTRLREADAITEDTDAVAAYKKLSPALPEIQLRIVQRQWRVALEQLSYLRRARSNSELKNESAVYDGRLARLLDEIVERSGATLADAPSLRPDIVWRLYNTSGAAKVLSALVMLESEQNADKVQGVMRDALADFKAAIEAVDRAGVSPRYRNVPRWNFEVLNGEENVRKFEVSMTDAEKNQALKENLETLIPDIGGYAPGEPLETRVKK